MDVESTSYHRLPFLAMFVALGLILSFLESLLPVFFGVPGMKLGLCNVLVVWLLYNDDAKGALTVNALRIVLAGFLFGNPFSIAYSLAGAALSFAVMVLVKRTGQFRVATVSILGGIAHNLGQLLLAGVLLSSAHLFWYAPVLIGAGAVTGFLIGVVALELSEKTRPIHGKG